MPSSNSTLYPQIPDTVKLAILIPTVRWGGQVKSVLSSFVGVACKEIAVLIADNSENSEKKLFLEKLHELNKWIIPVAHEKNIGATGNFFFLHDWCKDIEFSAIMADDDYVSPDYYRDSFDAFSDNPRASCIARGTSFADFGDHQLHDVSQTSMVGASLFERLQSWNGLVARITMYDVSRRSTLTPALAYLKATPLHGLTLAEDLFELSRLTEGDFLRLSGRGLFVHYPHYGSKTGDTAERFYNLLCRGIGLKRPMVHFMGLSTAIQCALFLLGNLSPILDKKQKNLCAQLVFRHLFFDGFAKDFSNLDLRRSIRNTLIKEPYLLKGFDHYCGVSRASDFAFDFEIVKWFTRIIKVFEIKPSKNHVSLSEQFEGFCSGLLSESDIDASVLQEIEFEPTANRGVTSSGWKVSNWFSERAPSDARVMAIRTMLGANPNVGTLGVVVIVSDEASPQELNATLESVRAQHRPVDSLWMIGKNISDDATSEDVELLLAETHWARVLSDRISQGNAPDFLWVLFAGDRLLPHATLAMGEYRLRKPDPLVWYVDEATVEGGEPVRPMFKPDFNVDLLRNFPYIGRNLVVSTAAVQMVGGLDERLADLALIDFVWRLVEQVGPPVAGHIPEVLLTGARSLMDWVGGVETMTWFPAATQAHFVRMGLEANVLPGLMPGLQTVEYPLISRPLISIIIPTRDQLSILRSCIEGLMEHTRYPNYELLIVDNGSVEPEAVKFLASLESMGAEQVRVLRWPQKFNFAAMNNYAVDHARGDVLLFLNNDIQFSSQTRTDWLERLLRHALRSEVGMVGARLDLLDGGVEQCGQVLGLDNSVGLAFRGLKSDKLGYMNRLIAQQNVSALSAACLMMRRSVFEELGGFDADTFPVYYGDADLCMKATQAGYLLVLEPDSGLLHMGGATRLQEKFGVSAKPSDEERDRLYGRWLPQLARDPNYHPAFSKYSPGFSLSPDGARIHDPLPGRPLPVVLASHADWQGCGHYRIIQPFQALEGSLRVEGGLKFQHLHFTDVARIEPDVLVLQGAWANEGIVKQIERYQSLVKAKVVLEFDDYVPNIPTRSIYRQLIAPGAIKKIRRAIEKADWLVVSTPALAEEYGRYHDDIRVAHNGLSRSWWGSLSSQRGMGKKPRVGWAGGSSHAGDLAVIRFVVKELADEVEWVFMGMQPEDVVCEFHPGVPIDQYPQKLASLNLDLAVVPLEINQFNICKSNLRLLELGACGVPVICTDIEPYRCGLPVTRIRNRPQDWIEAIRSHLADMDALAKQGDALRENVMQNWMLEGDFLDQWAKAWTPGKL